MRTLSSRNRRHKKPQTRCECANGPRPCPWVSCRYHLFLDVNPVTGSIKFNFPGKEVWELPHTCALDIADEGGMSPEEIGGLLNVCRERIRQLYQQGLKICRDALEGNTASAVES